MTKAEQIRMLEAQGDVPREKAAMPNGMAFFRDAKEREKCWALDSIVKSDGFYIDYGDENDIEEEA